MKFSLFAPPVARHLLKSREYLEEAHLKRAEHQAAAEYHGALTQLYADRISRIEAEIKQALLARSDSHQPAPATDDERAHPVSAPVVMYPARVSHA